MTPKILAALSARRAWLMVPEVLTAMYASVQLEAKDGESIERKAASPSSSRASGNIAVLPLHGMIEQRGSIWMDIFGGTSTEEFGAAYDAAMNDPKVKGIVVDIDSPGGTVGGVMELSDKIYNSRGQKPVVAVANSLAASAAYWIGSAFDQLFVTPGGDVGSIGVYSMHLDFSKAMEAGGVVPTIFQVPEFKAEFSPYIPLSDAAKQNEQAQVERVYNDFVAAVARNRGTTATKVKADFGQGRVVDAKSAVAAGMADKVATMEKVVSRMAAGKFKSTDMSALALDDWDGESDTIITSTDWKLAFATQKKASDLRMKGLLNRHDVSSVAE